MDYNSIDSELIESLDFLRPPVKRVFGNKSTFTPDSHTNNIKVLKNIRKQLSKDCQLPQSKLRSRTAESSTSLILKKTIERDIYQQYSVLSYSNLLNSRQQTAKFFPTYSPQAPKEKPIIKVTVIPKTIQTQVSNVLKKRKHNPKRIHTTVSNQENSIQTKNVFLVVQGQKREKIYEIRTTGSAKFTNVRSKNEFKDEVIPIEQLSSLQLVLDSLNMDRDRERDRRRRKHHEDFVEFTSDIKGNGKRRECSCWNAVRANESINECACWDEARGKEASNLVVGKSRVRITGRLGLTEDERYVLRCAATVDDKPVEADYTEMKQTVPMPSFVCRETRETCENRNFNTMCERDNCWTRCYNATTFCTQKRDFNIQADLQNENKYETPEPPKIMRCNECKGTQVNFNTGLFDGSRCKNLFPIKDEIIQCCRANLDTRVNVSDSESDSSSTKACQSPLVIISVYPMQEYCENLKVVKTYQDDNKFEAPQKPNVSGHTSRPRSRPRPNNEKKTDSKVASRSRSPSPQNKKSPQSKPNMAETRILRANTRKASPGRDVSPSPYQPNRYNRIIPDKTANKTNYTTSYRQSYGSPQNKSAKTSKGMNTDHTLTKKALVDNYTKELTDFLKTENDVTKFTFPRSDQSKVTVAIDGNNEYYNVLFQQANSTTDLKVSKTVKSNNNKKVAENVKRTTTATKSPSPREERKRKSSPVQPRNQKKDGHTLEQTFSRLQVRDSIEISHRRDYKPPVDHTVKNNQNSEINSHSSQFSAPIKHYRGDSCLIADPIKRDKEIRALLGVDKGAHTSTSPGFKVEEKNFAVPLRYFCGKTCENQIVTGINIIEMPEPPCVCQIQRNSAQLQEQKSQRNRKVTASSVQIDKETAEQEQTSSDPSSTEERNPSPVVESPSPVEDSPNPMKDSPSPMEEIPSPVAEKTPSKSKASKSIRHSKAKSTGTQYETEVRPTSLYQQLILNRNIQLFLQVEQFSKQKPIILSRKQYDKVKRTIESTIASKTGRDYKRKKCICKISLVSVGNVRRKTQPHQSLHYDKQSEINNKELAANVKHSSSASNKSKKSDKPAKKNKSAIVLFSQEEKHFNAEKGTAMTPRQEAIVTPRQTNVMTPRKAMSSMEIQYASMSYMKRVTFSSTNVEAGSICPPPLEQKESHSIHTIFKGHRKCPTPNLGTSVYSLYSEANNAMVPQKPLLMAQESKQKKPFLRRLMSCLVMRSTMASDLKNTMDPPLKVPSINSSIDSYHISTSLGAIEVSSSIYDTSASFYSNHSIYPVNSKMKRSFFSSVREFLSIRRS